MLFTQVVFRTRFCAAVSVLFLFVLLLLSSCLAAERDFEAAYPAAAKSSMEPMRDMSVKETYSDGAPAPLASVNAPPVEQERARIYSASLSLEVTRIETVRNSLGGRALEIGGRIEAISSEGIIVLVPAEYFFSYIDEAKAYGVLLDRNITALDVSETSGGDGNPA